MLAMSQETEEFLTAQEAAVAAKVNIRTIYRWTAHGLRTYRPGGRGHYRILKSDLMDYLQTMDGMTSAVEESSSSAPPMPENYVAPLLNRGKNHSKNNQ